MPGNGDMIFASMTGACLRHTRCHGKTARECEPFKDSFLAHLRCVTRSSREPEAFCLRLAAFFQDGLMRALRARAFSYGLVGSHVWRVSGWVLSRPFR